MKYIPGKGWDIPVITKPLDFADINDSMTLEPGKTTLTHGESKMVVYSDKIEFYEKDKHIATYKKDAAETKHYKLKKIFNTIFKTKFKLYQDELILHTNHGNYDIDFFKKYLDKKISG